MACSLVDKEMGCESGLGSDICKKRKNQWLMVNLVFERGENQVHQAIQISVQISLLGQACVSVMLV